MGFAAVSPRFCCVCGTGHSDRTVCPGELRATGAERPGWRVNIETPFGHQAIGVLLAPSHDQWRARIITYPNVLWSAPGGRGALKFVGGTRDEAEAQAIAFIEDHVRGKRYLRRDGMAPVTTPRARQAEGSPARPGLMGARRKTIILPVRFGLDRAFTRGMTFNLSSEGMFIGVLTPEEAGRSLLIHLQLEGHSLPLRGLVMWNRLRAETERPVGMGIRLSDPPPFYQTFVAGLP
jgi:hypothetical protein